MKHRKSQDNRITDEQHRYRKTLIGAVATRPNMGSTTARSLIDEFEPEELFDACRRAHVNDDLDMLMQADGVGETLATDIAELVVEEGALDGVIADA